MGWTFDDGRSIYVQLVEQIQARIIKGQYSPGSKLQTVRELAGEAKVNPNTMQKALAELERTGLVYAQRTNGRFVTEDEEMIQRMRKQKGIDVTRQFISQMEEIGYTREEIMLILEELKEGEHS